MRVGAALKIVPIAIRRQPLSFSGNEIFQAELPGGTSVVVRISPRPRTFAYTQQNLDALRKLDIPVQDVLAPGSISGDRSFIILSWIPGRDLMYELPTMRSEADRGAASRKIVEYQRCIGKLPMSRGFGWAPIGKSAGTLHSTIYSASRAMKGWVASDAAPLDLLRYRLALVRQKVEPYFSTVKPVCFLDYLTIKNVIVENGEVTG